MTASPHRAIHLEYQSRTLRLLVAAGTAVNIRTRMPLCVDAYPSSKCLHRFSASCALVLHFVHSSRKTTFFVVLAFLWKTGFV